MNGVVKTNGTKWVSANTVKDFSFIFHRMDIRSGLYSNASGMDNAFYTRYKLFTKKSSLNHTVRILSENEHYPFSHLLSNSLTESTHHRIFLFLKEMKQNADSFLWTERKFNAANGIGRAPSIFVSIECWKYFCARLEEDESFDDIILSGRIDRTTLKNFFMA